MGENSITIQTKRYTRARRDISSENVISGKKVGGRVPAYDRPMKILSPEYGIFRPYLQKYFVKRILPCHSVLLDPMAGTSPLIPFIETHGYTAYLNDISPVHFYINRAKQYRIFQCYRKYGYEWFYRQLSHCMASLKGRQLSQSHKWIDDEILGGLVEAWRSTEGYGRDITVFLRAAIVVSVRSISSFATSKNPTWFKPGGISFKKNLPEIIRESLTTFDKYYSDSYDSLPMGQRGQCIFSIQDAARLSLKRKVDIVLTSPQYCNRLDTVALYGPELYFLAAVEHPVSNKDVVGTNQVGDYEKLESDFEYLTSNSAYANRLLNKIKTSPKRDDPGYYLKYYTRYFSMLLRALRKAGDYLSPEGKMYIVLQDNTHRGQDIEIDKVVGELLRVAGWRFRTRKMGQWHHLGLRNPSQNHAYVKRKQFEKLMVVWR